VIAAHKGDFEGKTVVTFCTGGIRRESRDPPRCYGKE
jgi:predicted sulfurtransferase